MKVLALRVKDVGGFAGPVAVEGFSGGLDVLAGANEAGKSTLFRALETLFSEKYLATNTNVQALKPYAGGAPLIEADFEQSGTRWRLRKRYLAGKLAELVDLGTGTKVRNADAEEQLQAMLAGGLSGTAALRLLWVGQQGSLQPVALDKEMSGGVARLIERELASVASSGRLSAMAKTATERLGLLVSPGERSVPRGSYKEAITFRDQLAASVQVLSARLAEAEKRSQNLGEARRERGLLAAPDAVLLRHDRLEAARGGRDKAADAKARLDLADEQCRRLALEEKQATAATAAFHRAFEEMAEASDAIAAIADALTAADAEAKAAAAALQSIAPAQSSKVTPERLREAAKSERLIETLRAQTAGSSALLTAHYPQSAKRRFEAKTSKGKLPLEQGQALIVDQRLEIEIDGIGTLTIEPGDAATAGDIKKKLEDAGEKLKGLLAEMAVGSFADAEAKLAAVEADRQKFDVAREAGAKRLHQAELDLLARRHANQALLQQLQAAEARLPPPDARGTHADKLEDAAETATRRYGEALRLKQALGQDAGDEARRRELIAAFELASTAANRADRRIAELDVEIARLEGAITADGQDGIGERLAEDTDQLTAAGSAVKRFEIEVAALKRLSAEFTAIGSARHGEIRKPVSDVLLPYAQMLFPEIALNFGADWSVENLARSGAPEPFDRLSDGTREQIAMLVRLGFAGLFAKLAHPFPLILDDALVYSDDDRLARMFQVLRQASEKHQVIVLTCRKTSFAGLGGKALEIREWREGIGNRE